MTSTNDLLTCLRIKGFGKVEVIQEATGSPNGEVEALLAGLVEQQLAEGTKVGFRLTAAGKTRADQALEQERATVAQPLIEHEYERFIPINSAFKDLITRWQMRTIDGRQVRNDHTDAAYDQTVLDELSRVHHDVSGVIDDIARLVPRAGAYRVRLGRALEKIKANDLRYVTAPDRDSYHTVWFELHQDLIGLIGTTRQKEAAAGRAV
jgi:pyruvate, orthophosphate dikinase